MTKIAGAYNSYRQQVLNGGIIFFAAIVSGQGSHAVVSLATVYIFQLVVLWWAIRHVPPSVLVLGPASQSLAEEVDDLRRALRPHRVILMFPSDRQPSTFEEVVPQVIFDKLDNFRTHFDSNWKDAFRVLLDAAPVVLVDGRSSTANLKFEAEAVAKTGGKAVFLISANSATALLDGLGDAEREFYSRKAVQLDSMDASVVMAALEVARLAKADRDGG
jgi:hypothetical protein